MRRLIALLMALVILGLTFAQPLLAAKPSSAFPPGTWKGKAVWTGSINNGDVVVTVVGAGIVDFELTVAPDGAVTDGFYTLNETAVSEDISSIGHIDASVFGMGNMKGTGNLVTGYGNFKIKINSWPLPIPPTDFDSSGDTLGFYPTTASCTFVQGDMADLARPVQESAGFSTTIKAPFTATRINAPGEKGSESWIDTYVKLVTEMESLISKPSPTVKEIMDLALKVNLFSHNLVEASTCADAPQGLEKGKQPYNYFLEKFSQLLLNVLVDPSAYSAADLADLLVFAINIGAVGSAAPDTETAKLLESGFQQVLGLKLDQAIAAGDKNDILLIKLAAIQAGFNGLYEKAKAAEEKL